MANTRRESTVHPRSENATDTAGSGPISALGFDPNIHTAVPAIRQEVSRAALPIRKQVISLIAKAVDIAFALHNKTNGSTVSLLHGDMARRKLFSVSIYPKHTIELRNPPSWQQIFEFALENWELLLKPRHALGTWLNEGVHVLDIVVYTPDLAEALTLGLRFNQLSIYDLEVLQVIPVPRPYQEIEASGVEGSHA
jgi:hypothetical protein